MEEDGWLVNDSAFFITELQALSLTNDQTTRSATV